MNEDCYGRDTQPRSNVYVPWQNIYLRSRSSDRQSTRCTRFRKSVEDTLATGRTLAFYRQAYIGYTKSSSVTDRHRTLRIDNSSTKGFGISLLKVIPITMLNVYLCDPRRSFFASSIVCQSSPLYCSDHSFPLSGEYEIQLCQLHTRKLYFQAVLFVIDWLI